MFYKFTQLKDLPTSDAGTVFHSVGTVYRRIEGKITPFYKIVNGTDVKLEPVGGVYDNPDWFEKTVEIEQTQDLRCPVCGATNGLFITDSYHRDTPDSDDICFEIAFECICGHIRPLISQGPSRGMIRYSQPQQKQ